jgi:hypothetical protein
MVYEAKRPLQLNMAACLLKRADSGDDGDGGSDGGVVEEKKGVSKAADGDDAAPASTTDRIIEYCGDVLKHDPNNSKALLRRGQAHLIRGDHASAKGDLEQADKADAAKGGAAAASSGLQSNKAIRKALDQVKAAEKADRAASKELWGGKLPKAQDPPPPQQKDEASAGQHGHGHSHGGVPCSGHDDPPPPQQKDEASAGQHGHGHSHGGVPCSGHHDDSSGSWWTGGAVLVALLAFLLGAMAFAKERWDRMSGLHQAQVA